MKKLSTFFLLFFILISASEKVFTVRNKQVSEAFKHSKHYDIPDYFKDDRYQFEM